MLGVMNQTIFGWFQVFSSLLSNNHSPHLKVNPTNPNQIAVRTASKGCFYYNSGDCYFSVPLSSSHLITISSTYPPMPPLLGLSSPLTIAIHFGATLTKPHNVKKHTYFSLKFLETTLFFDVSAQTSGPQTGNDYNLFKTYDYGATSKLILENTAGFIIKNGGLYVAQVIIQVT